MYSYNEVHVDLMDWTVLLLHDSLRGQIKLEKTV